MVGGGVHCGSAVVSIGGGSVEGESGRVRTGQNRYKRRAGV